MSLFDRFFIVPGKQISKSQIKLCPPCLSEGLTLAQFLNEADRRVVLVDGQEMLEKASA